MATTQGTAIVWGGSVTDMSAFTAAVASGYTFTGEDWAEEKDKVELKDKSGEIKTIYYYNTRTTSGFWPGVFLLPGQSWRGTIAYPALEPAQQMYIHE